MKTLFDEIQRRKLDLFQSIQRKDHSRFRIVMHAMRSRRGPLNRIITFVHREIEGSHAKAGRGRLLHTFHGGPGRGPGS